MLSPLLLLMAAWVKLDSSGSVFFRQERVGQYGKTFRIHKFRTMVTDAEKRGLQITVGKDSRITRSGAFLRRYKLDEFPQLIDVVIGNMSLVGPRPEVPKYVACYPVGVRDLVLSVKPGITDLASIEFKNENTLLGQSRNPEKTYKEIIIPIKLDYYTRYAKTHNIWLDINLIFKTLVAIVR